VHGRDVSCSYGLADSNVRACLESGSLRQPMSIHLHKDTGGEAR
jgi:hypothetical protein